MMIDKIYKFRVKFCVKGTITWMHGLCSPCISGGLDRSLMRNLNLCSETFGRQNISLACSFFWKREFHWHVDPDKTFGLTRHRSREFFDLFFTSYNKRS